MIELTRLNGQAVIINADVIKLIETTPDTLLTLTTGEKMPVEESAYDVIEKCVAFKARIFQSGPVLISSQAKTDGMLQ